jgi:pyruvate kinase
MYAATPDARVMRQLNLSWGVRGLSVGKASAVPELIEQALSVLKKDNNIVTGDEIIIVAGEPLGESGHVNLVELRKI